jgi:hypothetical protein
VICLPPMRVLTFSDILSFSLRDRRETSVNPEKCSGLNEITQGPTEFFKRGVF